MTTVFQVYVGGNGDRVASTLQGALEHAAASVCRPVHDGPGRDVTHPWWAESLGEAGLAGSLPHRIIHAVNEDNIDMAVAEHDPDRPAGMTSMVDMYDFQGFDPSFLVQQTLYQAEASEQSPERLVAQLRARIHAGVGNARLGGRSDRAIVDRLIKWQVALAGPEVLVAGDDPAAALAALPEKCVEVFEAGFAAAFPDEAGRLPEGPGR